GGCQAEPLREKHALSGGHSGQTEGSVRTGEGTDPQANDRHGDPRQRGSAVLVDDATDDDTALLGSDPRGVHHGQEQRKEHQQTRSARVRGGGAATPDEHAGHDPGSLSVSECDWLAALGAHRSRDAKQLRRAVPARMEGSATGEEGERHRARGSSPKDRRSPRRRVVWRWLRVGPPRRWPDRRTRTCRDPHAPGPAYGGPSRPPPRGSVPATRGDPGVSSAPLTPPPRPTSPHDAGRGAAPTPPFPFRTGREAPRPGRGRVDEAVASAPGAKERRLESQFEANGRRHGLQAPCRPGSRTHKGFLTAL